MDSKKILGWEIYETNNFLKFVLNNRQKTLSQIFYLWAKNNGRAQFSVRNYFYKLLRLLEKDESYHKFFDFDLNILFDFIGSKHFSEKQNKQLLFAILPTKNQTSVRKACLNFAGGNQNLMLKYQNKYRQLLKNDQELVKIVLNELKNQNINVRNPFKNEKIIKMPQTKFSLSNDDINSLFLGLVKLIKNNYQEEQQNKQNLALKNLKDENSKLKLKFKTIINKLETNDYNNFKDNSKMNSFKEFLKVLSFEDCSKEKE